MSRDTVSVVDPGLLEPLGQSGRDRLRVPHGVGFDRLGRLLVADSGKIRIPLLEADGLDVRVIDEARANLPAPWECPLEPTMPM